MARIPADQLERLKKEIDLLRLVESQGYTVTKQGKDHAICCPFHDDKTPSLIISQKTNLFNCFGCGAAGSVIDWVMRTQGLSFRLACELLQKDIGAVAKPAASKPLKRDTKTKLTSSLAADLEVANVDAALNVAVDYYHEQLLASPEALDYLAKRGLNDSELIARFKLGYANRTLAYHIPDKNRAAGKTIRATLLEAGIYRATGHEHFNGSIIVPILQGNDRIVECYGRRISDSNSNKGAPKHLYLPGPHAGVWNEQGLSGYREIILCEALLDAMAFWVNGFKNVTASYGTQGFTDDHLALFKKLDVKRVLTAYDRDEAGNLATEKVTALLQKNGIDCFRILLPKGMDVNEYALKVTPAKQSLGLAIRKAEWLGNGVAPERQLSLDTLLVDDDQDETSEPSDSVAVENDRAIDGTGSDNAPVLAPELPSLPASPLPASLTDNIDCKVNESGNEAMIGIGDRAYRVRGLLKNTEQGQLKINLMACNESGYHTDVLELYNAKQRQVFINQAHIELGVKDEVVKKDLGKVLLKLETLQDEQRLHKKADDKTIAVSLSTDEHNAAMALLKSPDLLNQILKDFSLAGVVGEETNKLVGYLACVSRQLQKPLAVMIQSSSAAGKSSLMDSILALMPEEGRVQYSAMTGQSLFYMGETNLKHKILAIAEEEGASNASYALKLLQSEGEVTIASTGKDEASGDLVTKEYTVQGPVMLFLTTTAIDIDEELMNRCLVLTVNESREQTQAIHTAQRQKRTLQGLQNSLEKERVISLHKNAQRLLRPLKVINPYADQLTFLDDKTRTRRDHEKYLTLIDSIVLLHQYQREVKTIKHQGKVIEYIEATLDDIETANRLANEVLGKTLDELPPQTRKLLSLITQQVNADCATQRIDQDHFRFSRRYVRELCGWSEKQVRVHMQRLMDMEYLLTHKGGRGQSFEYELLYQGEGPNGQPFLMGLLDIESLKPNTTTATSWGKKAEVVGPSCGERGPLVGATSPHKNRLEPLDYMACEPSASYTVENARPASQKSAHRSDSAIVAV